MYFDRRTMGATPYGDCVSALGGADLYGDCDYLIPLGNMPYVANSTAGGSVNTGNNLSSFATFSRDFDAWLAKGDNKTMLMFGAAILVILLTKKR